MNILRSSPNVLITINNLLFQISSDDGCKTETSHCIKQNVVPKAKCTCRTVHESVYFLNFAASALLPSSATSQAITAAININVILCS